VVKEALKAVKEDLETTKQQHKYGLQTVLYHISQMDQRRIDLHKDLLRELREGRRSVEEILRESEESHKADLDFLKGLLGEILAEQGISPEEVDEE